MVDFTKLDQEIAALKAQATAQEEELAQANAYIAELEAAEPVPVVVDPAVQYGYAQLYDAEANVTLTDLKEGGSYAIGGKKVSVIVIPSVGVTPAAASVRFLLDGAIIRTESARPWAMFGDANGAITGGAIPVGDHVLELEFFSETGGAGAFLGRTTYYFSVTAAPIPAPAPAPAPAPSPIVTPTSDAWPKTWDDPRFANNVNSGRLLNYGDTDQVWKNKTIVDASGDPVVAYHHYQLINSRIDAREGPRVSGSDILIDGCYIKVYGSGSDHADGIQGYAGGSQYNAKNIVIRNTAVILVPNTALNCGIFFADKIGADLTLENVFVDGANAPNGAIWLPCTDTDKGVLSLIARNVVVKNSNGRQGLSLAPKPSLCKILAWENVRWADGTPIPNPNA